MTHDYRELTPTKRCTPTKGHELIADAGVWAEMDAVLAMSFGMGMYRHRWLVDVAEIRVRARPKNLEHLLLSRLCGLP